MKTSWRNFYEAAAEPLDKDEFLVVYLDATDPDSVEKILGDYGYTRSNASDVLGIKLGEYAFSECDLTQYPGDENIVDAIIVYHALPKCWSLIDSTEEGLAKKKLLAEAWFAIPSVLIIDFGFDLLHELDEEARSTYP
jgi:hypothetical protein